MPKFTTDHPLSWAFAKQCVRVGLVPTIPALLVESFLRDEKNKAWLFDRITLLPLSNVIFDFDVGDDTHREWAAFAISVGVWGMVPPSYTVTNP